jgi:hypothetical protein
MKRFFLPAFALILSVSAVSAQEVTVMSFPHQGPAVSASATYQGIAIAGMSVSLEGNGIAQPCLTGVPNCAPDIDGGLSVAFPRYFLMSGGETLVIIVVEDTSYTGTCSLGVTVKNASSATLGWGFGPVGCQPNTDYVIYFRMQLPDPVSPAWEPVSVNAGLILSGDRDGTVVSGATLPAVLGQGGAVPYPTIIGPASISIGSETPGLPCSNCGSSGLGANIAIPAPMYAVPRSEPLTVTLVTENVNYTGACTFEYAIKQGATKIASGSRSPSGGCAAPPGAGFVTAWNLDLPAEVTPGLAVVVGALVAGSNTYGIFQQILIH